MSRVGSAPVAAGELEGRDGGESGGLGAKRAWTEGDGDEARGDGGSDLGGVEAALRADKDQDVGEAARQGVVQRPYPLPCGLQHQSQTDSRRREEVTEASHVFHGRHDGATTLAGGFAGHDTPAFQVDAAGLGAGAAHGYEAGHAEFGTVLDHLLETASPGQALGDDDAEG